jgi:hypothetical protein
VYGTKVVPLESMVYSGDEGTEGESASDRALLDDSYEEEEHELATQQFVESVLDHIDNDLRSLVCLRFGVIDSVKTRLNRSEALREVLRQTACKALLQQSMAVTADDRMAMLRSEAITAE